MVPRQITEKDTIAARRAKVARYRALGETERSIAARFGVTQQLISADLKVIRAEWRRAMIKEYDAYKAEQVATINAVAAEALRGWRRSLRDAEKVTRKVTPADPPPSPAAGEGDAATVPPSSPTVTEETAVTEGQAGDPRFLQVMLKCVEERNRLYGVTDGQAPAPPITIIEVTVHQAPAPPPALPEAETVIVVPAGVNGAQPA
jgi:hypothetical protein